MSREKEPFRLVALAGPAGVGKTTIAEQLTLTYNFKVVSFAGALKQSLVALTGLTPSHFNKMELKEKQIPGLDYSPRTLMQKFGTEFVRDMVHPNFWVWRMKNTIDKEQKYDIIIDDVRFNNEAKFIRDYGGLLIHLDRDFESPTVHTDHVSEKPVRRNKFDCFVYENSIRETYTKCVKHVEDFYGK